MDTKTITIQIGNSDNKLTQKEWSDFASIVHTRIDLYVETIHFAGASNPLGPWQNAAWIIEISNDDDAIGLQQDLGVLAHLFNQDSIAWTVGETSFIRSKQ